MMYPHYDEPTIRLTRPGGRIARLDGGETAGAAREGMGVILEHGRPSGEDRVGGRASGPGPSRALPPRTQRPVWRDLVGLAIKIAVVGAVFALIFSVSHGLSRTADPDMAPAVNPGDLVMFYRLDKGYEPGDLVVLSVQGQTQVRRVVATAGDTVDIADDLLVVNGSPQQEPAIHEPTHRYADGIALPVTLGAGQVFVLGDARQDATDSRVYGPVNTNDTLGTVIAVVKWRDL